jgi:hypothetical protein
VIAFMKPENLDVTPPNQHARNLLLIARARLLDAEEWLRKQDEAHDERSRHISEDYHMVARSQLRDVVRTAVEVAAMLRAR